MALSSAFACAAGFLSLAALPFFAAFSALTVLPASFFAFFFEGLLEVFLAIFAPIITKHGRAKPPRQHRAHAFFRDHHAASLAVGGRLHGGDGAGRRRQLRRRIVLLHPRSLASRRLPRPRRAADLLGVPGELPIRSGVRAGDGDALRIAAPPRHPS